MPLTAQHLQKHQPKRPHIDARAVRRRPVLGRAVANGASAALIFLIELGAAALHILLDGRLAEIDEHHTHVALAAVVRHQHVVG
eukprot:CAMPEP_0198352540 /NCGR_PEP_ID=MMETSP1450-20131203/107623_1 /TAXON_ID=753684 ORGANISM="Madagascaria erythrocladiodes, Strain CCMP3234" /NCGR_SAMPLE_ID=MMETSP1450 /ASSEMBLY_ACC=CAM_ASM_001115 /LENGTH=83 /DNA_ID=CAMNT_0044058575 /DNA_START=3 /DNA_END=251 /DNA_ORIENTATION=-